MDKLDELLNHEIQGSKNIDMQVDTLNTTATTPKVLKPSSMENTQDSYSGTGEMIFASFNMLRQLSSSEDLMKGNLFEFTIHSKYKFFASSSRHEASIEPIKVALQKNDIEIFHC